MQQVPTKMAQVCHLYSFYAVYFGRGCYLDLHFYFHIKLARIRWLQRHNLRRITKMDHHVRPHKLVPIPTPRPLHLLLLHLHGQHLKSFHRRCTESAKTKALNKPFLCIHARSLCTTLPLQYRIWLLQIHHLWVYLAYVDQWDYVVLDAGDCYSADALPASGIFFWKVRKEWR